MELKPQILISEKFHQKNLIDGNDYNIPLIGYKHQIIIKRMNI